MKKLLILLTTIVSASLASVYTYPQAPESQTPKPRIFPSTLYYDFSLGITRQAYNYDDGMVLVHDLKKEYIGYGGTASIRLGGLIKGMFAPHAIAEAVLTEGDYHLSKRRSSSLSYYKYDDTRKALRMFLGGGIMFYPFRNPSSAMHGSFAGIDIGYMKMVDSRQSAEDDYGIKSDGIGIKYELGKVWNISEHLSIGINIFGSADASTETHIENGDGTYTTFGLGFKFVRR